MDSTNTFEHCKGQVEEEAHDVIMPPKPPKHPTFPPQLAFSRLCVYRPGLFHGKSLSCVGDILSTAISPLLEVSPPET